MANAPEPAFPAAVHPAVREWAEEFSDLWTRGRLQLQVQTAPPTSTVNDGEMRLVVTGGSLFLYAFTRETGWRGVALTL